MGEGFYSWAWWLEIWLLDCTGKRELTASIFNLSPHLPCRQTRWVVHTHNPKFLGFQGQEACFPPCVSHQAGQLLKCRLISKTTPTGLKVFPLRAQGAILPPNKIDNLFLRTLITVNKLNLRQPFLPISNLEKRKNSSWRVIYVFCRDSMGYYFCSCWQCLLDYRTLSQQSVLQWLVLKQ